MNQRFRGVRRTSEQQSLSDVLLDVWSESVDRKFSERPADPDQTSCVLVDSAPIALPSFWRTSSGCTVPTDSDQTSSHGRPTDTDRTSSRLRILDSAPFGLWLRATLISMIPIIWWEDQPGTYSDSSYIEVFRKIRTIGSLMNFYLARLNIWRASRTPQGSGSFFHLPGSLYLSKFVRSLSDLRQNATGLR